MGHRRLAGLVTETELAGHGVLRLDVPAPEAVEGAVTGESPSDWESTQFYSPTALYCLTPVSEETARRVAHLHRPQPVQQWELPSPPVTAPEVDPDIDFHEGDER
jgi:hypothetical protein